MYTGIMQTGTNQQKTNAI